MKIISAAVLLLATAGVASAESRQMVMKVDGVERRAIVFAPKASGAAAPLIFAFHGAGDTAENFSAVGFQDAWPQALVVYMNALSRTPGGGGAFQTSDTSAANRDLKFFDLVLTDLKRQFRVDDRQIYATGFSNGAKFVYLLWATRAKTFAAFAPVAGMLTAKTTLAEPKPLMHIGGRQDRQNEFQLQLESVETGRSLNDATGKAAGCGTNCAFYSSPKGAPVMTVLHPGGHVYPTDATALIITFFRAYP